MDERCGINFRRLAGVISMFLGVMASFLAFTVRPAAANEAADIDQCRNDTHANDVPCLDGAWVNGNAGAQQAHFAEGEAMPFRLRFSDLVPGSTNVVTIEWDYLKSDVHAYDYLVSYNFSETDANPCTADAPAFDGCNVNDVDTFPIPADPTLNDPSFSGTQEPGVFSMFEGDITGVSGYTFAADGADDANRITITFVAGVADPVLAWGGHLGSRFDWGNGNSASAISGSPYHMRLIDLNGSGGNQDRSLSSDAVVAPASITIVKDSQPNSAQAFSFTASGGLLPAAFDLTDDGTPGGESTTYSGITDFDSDFVFTEGAAPGTTLSAIDCTESVPGGVSTDVATRAATINLDEGENVTCTFVNASAAPTIMVTKTANPTSLPEPGGNVTFTVQIQNTSPNEIVTVDSIEDSDFGNLGATNGAVTGEEDCVALIGTTIAIGATVSCDFVAPVTGNADFVHNNIVTVGVHDDEGQTATDDDDATVTIEDVAPQVTVLKAPAPDSLPETTGGNVTYTVRVTNTVDEPITVTDLDDDRFGDIDVDGNPALVNTTCDDLIGDVIPATNPDSFVECTFTATLAPQNAGTTHVNTVTVTVTDDDGSPATDADDAVVTFTDVAPTVTIVKTATPTEVPETGGNVTFSFTVTNTSAEPVMITSLSDDRFGSLTGDSDCQVGTVLAPSASCAFSFGPVNLAQDTGTTHTNVATVVVTDDDGSTANDTDDAVVTFADVLPVIVVDKTANPTSVPEVTPTDVTFSVSVTNQNAEAVTITALDDDVFGPLAGDADCQVGTVLAGGASCSFSFVESLTGDSGDDHVDIVTATAIDDDGNSDSDDDPATVTFTDLRPTITVDKAANPVSLPEPGGNVTYTVTVANTSIEPVEITGLSDDTFGVLAGDADCQDGTILAVGGSCSFQFSQPITGNAGFVHTNVVTATAEDDEGNEASDTDDAVVTITDVGSSIVVTKSANPTAVPEPGADVTFTVAIQNTSVTDSVTIDSIVDDVFGDLADDGNAELVSTTCDDLIGDVLAAGGSTNCTFVAFIGPDAQVGNGAEHHDTVLVSGTDDDELPVSDDDDATVDITDVLPTITVDKSAVPTSIPEGAAADVTFTVTVTNGSVEPVTIVSLEDDVFGVLAGDADCQVGTVLPVGGACGFTFVGEVAAGDAGGAPHQNTVTVVVVDDEENEGTDDDPAVVPFTDVPPTVTVTKDSNVAELPVGTPTAVTFTVTVTNGSVEPVTISSLTDSVFGTLAGDADCQVGTVLAVGASCTFTFVETLTLTGAGHSNVVTVVVTDDEGTTDSGQDDEVIPATEVLPQVIVREPVQPVQPTQLPRTGMDVGVPLGFGLLLIGLGMFLLELRPPRRFSF